MKSRTTAERNAARHIVAFKRTEVGTEEERETTKLPASHAGAEG